MHSPTRWRWATLVALLALFAALGLVLFAVVAASSDVPPRSLAPYLQKRLSNHGALLYAAGDRLAKALMLADRGEQHSPHGLLRLRVGAQSEPPKIAAGASNIVMVNTVDQALQAIEQAKPGDAITFAPGVYRFSVANISVKRAGTQNAPIVVRAERPGGVTLEMQVAEGFVVSAPYWTFENLTIRGVCAQHGECEHAFHIVAGATHFHARNNTLTDFNAHIKVNGEDHRFPDKGLLEGNTLYNTTARQTDNPVTTIDLVGASGWTIRGNLIADFVKAQGDRISYGAFAKGGGVGNSFERNIVLCESRLRGSSGWRVGLSLGGGGTGRAYCRDGACITEQDGGIVESNLIASCSDDGIYVNRSATSRIVHNTLIDTGGIAIRFEESGADVEGNLVDGAIRSRDGGLLRSYDNMQTSLTALYLGHHPQRSLYRDASTLDLSWKSHPPRRDAVARELIPSLDLCGAKRWLNPVYGAFEDFAACLEATSAASAASGPQ